MTFEQWWETQHAEECRELAEQAWAAAVKAERARCAEVCEGIMRRHNLTASMLREEGATLPAAWKVMRYDLAEGARQCAEAILEGGEPC